MYHFTCTYLYIIASFLIPFEGQFNSKTICINTEPKVFLNLKTLCKTVAIEKHMYLTKSHLVLSIPRR